MDSHQIKHLVQHFGGLLGEAFAGQKTTYHSELFDLDFGGFRVVIIPVVTGIVMGGGRTQIMYMVPEKK